jgi:hypothetical protein
MHGNTQTQKDAFVASENAPGRVSLLFGIYEYTEMTMSSTPAELDGTVVEL